MFEKRRSELIRTKMTGMSKGYKELGKVLDDLARGRDVRGPYNIAYYVKDATGYEVSGQAVSKYLYGEGLPKRAFVEAFSEAFKLTEQERNLLAYTYAYGSTGAAPNYQAFRDPLTDLPMRTPFMSRLGHALRRAERRLERAAVLVLDLDDFGAVNDSLGYEAGDRILVATAERLRACLRREDTVARLGGDEFAVLLEGLTGAVEATKVAARIEDRLRKPFALEGRVALVSASIGIALGTAPQSRPEDLVRSAAAAMYRAKDKGKARHEVFEPGMDTRARERLELKNDLRLAIEREEFVVLYQPEILLRTGEIVGMEALVYREHPGRGLVPPSEFFATIEGSHLILPIGRLLLREACQRARKWQEGHGNEAPPMVSVSLPARRFRQAGLVEEVASLLRETGLNPRGLNLKVAEDVAMEDPRWTITTLRKLKGLGLQLTLGGFGTGRSSIAYLNHFPVGFLEMDRSLVGGLREGSTDGLVVSGVISLAHALGLTASAEGAETSEKVGQLRRAGCDLAWGSYFSEPLSSDAAMALLAGQARTTRCLQANTEAPRPGQAQDAYEPSQKGEALPARIPEQGAAQLDQSRALISLLVVLLAKVSLISLGTLSIYSVESVLLLAMTGT